MPVQKLVNYFEGAHYQNAGEALRHAAEISRKIRAEQAKKPLKPKPPLRRVGEFTRQVLEIAPGFFNGIYYDRIGITREVVKRQARPLSEAEHKKLRNAISRSIKRLLSRKQLTPSKGYPPRAKKLREATSEQIAGGKRLIGYVIAKGHRFLPAGWREVLPPREAFEFGKEGLIRAIEIHDPAKGAKLSTIAITWIAYKIATEARKRLRQKTRSLDAPLGPEDKRTLHEKIGRPSMNPELLDNNLSLLVSSHWAKPHQIGIYALRKFGHSVREISGYFGVAPNAVHLHEKAAQAIIARRKATPDKAEKA